MWKITNQKNFETLNTFEEKIIRPTLLMLWDAAVQKSNGLYTIEKHQDIWKTTTPYKNFPREQQKIINYFFVRSIERRKFYEVFFELVQNYKKEVIISIIKQYVRQNYLINVKKDYNIPELRFPEEIKIIFVKFFYEKFFTMQQIWDRIVNKQYNRKIFHENFAHENYDIKVCPYCDIGLIVAKSSSYVEHFLPKAKFPLLAMNPYNLISSCDACNKGEEGKGESVKSDIVSPYNSMIGEFIDFKIKTEKVVLNNTSKLSSIENYLELLQLRKRYSQKRAFNYLKDEIEIQMEYFSEMDTLTSSKIDSFLSRRDRHSPFNIALRSIITKYPIYKS
ncbi:hypothetical protein [Salsuginibacillus kocurii]|uniref:hypothetical protein n=1 Tax=Salsuginibacillus kocurii TaxID=427078 RepID=UPI000372B999|nr:hypothetical protein [Salsuginibacillus kocurii]